jgi:hypothetical protein
VAGGPTLLSTARSQRPALGVSLLQSMEAVA